jgi:hypothetical protein
MKTAILTRLKRLEEVRAAENPAPVEFQTGYLKELPADYTGERHIVTMGRDPDGNYRWEERPVPEPNDDKRTSIPPFRVVLASPEEHPTAAAQTR